MAESGFEWFPLSVQPYEGPGESEIHDLRLQDESWVSIYGLGISTLVFHEDLVGPDLVGYDDERSDMEGFVSPEDGAEPSDPNMEYVDTLPDEELERYYATLAECSDDGLGGHRSPRHEAFLDQFGADHEALAREAETLAVERAPETDALACLADAGYEFGSFDAMTNSIRKELEPLQFEVFNPDGIDAGPESEAQPQTIRPLTEDQRARLAEIQAGEIEMAQAAQTCDIRPGRQHDAFGDAMYELEVQYVEDNADKLDAFLAEHPID